MKPLREQIGNWCVHFNGLQNTACKAGVVYDLLNEADAPKRWPCFKDRAEGYCALQRFPTEEEIDTQVAESQLALKEMVERLADNRCPTCDQPVTRRRQVGRCVYADPCGHRMYQGTA